MKKNIDKRLWGVPGKMKTYYSPQKQVEGKTKVPLNANAFDSWDVKRSRFKRIDGYENKVANHIQQHGVVPQATPIPPTPSSTPIPASPTPTPSITPTLTPSATPAAWNPSQFNNLYEWWSSDTGVNHSGGFVNSWTGYSGYVLQPTNLGNLPAYISSDSNFNNEPSIKINPSNLPTSDAGMKYNIGSTSSVGNKTMIVISKLILKSAEESSLMQYGIGSGNGQRVALFGLVSGSDYYYYQFPTLGQSGNTYNAGTYQIASFSYNNSTGITDFYVGNGSSGLTNFLGSITTSTSYQFGDTISIQDYNGTFGKSATINYVDVIVIDGIPSASEITNLQNYITTKYGII